MNCAERELGRQREQGLELAARLVGLALLLEDLDQGPPRGDGAWIGGQCLARFEHGLVESPLTRQDGGELGAPLDEVGRSLEHRAQLGCGLVVTAQPLVEASQREAPADAVGVEPRRFGIGVGRLAGLALRLHHHGQVVPGRRIGGIELERAPHPRLGDVDGAVAHRHPRQQQLGAGAANLTLHLFGHRIGEPHATFAIQIEMPLHARFVPERAVGLRRRVVERLRVGIELERALELARRVGVLSLARRQLAQRGVGVGGVGIELQPVFVERLRAGQVTLQRAHVAEPQQRRQVLRIGRSRHLVPARRLLQRAIVLVDGAQQIRPPAILRQQSVGVLERRRRRVGEVVDQVALAQLGEALTQLARIDAAPRRQAVETRARLGELVPDRGLDAAEVGMRHLAQRRQLGRGGLR